MSRIVVKVPNLKKNRTTPIPKEGKQSKNYLFIGFVPSYELKNFDKYKEYLSAIYTETNDKGEKKVAWRTNEPDIRHYRLSGKYNQDEIDIDEDTYNIYTMQDQVMSDYTDLNSWRVFGDNFFDVIFLDASVKGYIPSLNFGNTVYPFQDYDHADQIYTQIYKKLKSTGKFYHQTTNAKGWSKEIYREIENKYRENERLPLLTKNDTPLLYHNNPNYNQMFQGLFRYEQTVKDPIFNFRNPFHTRGQPRGYFKEYSKNIEPRGYAENMLRRLKS